MCLFFLLAGYFTPGSYNRKGPLLHVYDRLIRLLLPVVVYAVLIHPLILTINKAAGVPAAVAAKILPVAGFMQSASYLKAWRWWFAHFNIVFGPTWFIWCLFWFDVGYVLLRMLHKAAVKQGWLRRQSESGSAAAAAKGSSDGAARTATTTKQTSSGDAVIDVANGSSSGVSDKAAAVQLAVAEEYSVKAVLIGMAVLTLAFTAVSFGAVMATYNSDKAMGYDGFYVISPLIVFRPSWIGPNAISYILGCQAAKLNLLRKLPARMTFYCLGAAALWWPIGCGIPDYLALPYRPEELWGTHPISGAMVGYVLYSKFSQWAFAVVWAVGLLLLFRELFNHAPGRLGKQLIAGAYGAYIIHPLFIPLWAWAFRGVPFTTLVGNAIAVSPLVVVSSWAFTALVRCIPGTKRVLG
ncbi:hypothetical protein OEZ86_009178 [Tetradesmus obliquus]|nr:hypothetical protein OEZ86_009178 [Tetradesmus obliquus]